jgi:multidrug efflux system membrane fusion protein
LDALTRDWRRALRANEGGRLARFRNRRAWSIIVGAILVAACVVSVRVIHGESKTSASSRGPKTPAIPVVAIAATKGDIPVYLTGLGTVTPLNTVTVRSRVDGELVEVAFREGQIVHKGDLLAHVDPRPFQLQLTQAQGQAAKDDASLRNAKIDLQRYQVLIAQDAIPRQQLDTQVATVDQFAGTLKSDQAQIDSAKLNLVYSRITAPLTGRIGLRQVDPGNIVHAADQNGLAVIAQTSPIAVIFTIAQDSLPLVLRQTRAGQQLAVDAFNRDLNTRLATGSLLTIDNEIDPTTGTVRLKAVFANTDDSLYANQFVNARLLVDTIHGAIIVPTAAIQRSPQSTFVYVVKADNSVEVRNVQVRLTEGDRTAVQSGLSPGDVVVTEGVDKLQPGTIVAVRRSSGGPPASGATE